MANNWKETTWGKLATLEYGKSLRDYRKAEGGYRVYGTNGPIGWHDAPLCPFPSVIIGRKGAYRGIHFSSEPFFVIDTAFYLKPKVEFDIRWAYYELLTHDINGMDSGSAIPSTSRESFYTLLVNFPPLPEQKAVAHILGTLDDKLELNRRMNKTLEEIARAIFKRTFINPTEAILPNKWTAGSLGEEFNITMGQSPPGSTYNEIGEGMPFYQGRSDFGFRFPSRRVYCTAPTRFANAGDTLVSVRAPVGSLNMAEEKCCVGRGVAAVRHKSNSRSYTYYFIHSIAEEFERFEAEGTVFGSIGKSDFEQIECICPPEQVIKDFEVLIFPIDQCIETNEKQSCTLATLRDTLLPKLLSGEIRVKI